MNLDAREVFKKAGLVPEEYKEWFDDVAKILGETMAELSVKHATGVITGKQRIRQYRSQMNSLIKELKAAERSLQSDGPGLQF